MSSEILQRCSRHQAGVRCTDRGASAELDGRRAIRALGSGKKQREILGPMPECDIPAKKLLASSGMPPYLASLYEVPLLTREQEAHLFRKMNYLKYLARKLRETLDLDQPKVRLMDRIEKLYEESASIKNHIISRQPSVGGLDRQAVRWSSRGILRAGQRREHVVDAGGGEVRCLAGKPVQHLRQLGDHEELRPHHLRRAPSAGPFLHQSLGDLQLRRGRPHEPIRAGLRAACSRIGSTRNPQTTRQAGAADYRGPFWSRSRPGTANLEADRGRNGNIQRAGPTDPDPDHRQIEKGPKGDRPIAFAPWRRRMICAGGVATNLIAVFQANLSDD